VNLKEAVKFHGHLGPYLVLGLVAGEFALKRLKSKKYFALQVKVEGANKKPKSCLVDGLQLSTGATYGKGNIRKVPGSKIRIIFCDLKSSKKIELTLKKDLIEKLDALRGHSDSEAFAKKIIKIKPTGLFQVTKE
jgi:formylmethanofuran dehydrogenase subunit E